MPEWRDTLFKGRPKIGLDFFNAPRQRGNRTKCLVHSMGYGLCVDVQKSGTTQIQNVLDKGYNLYPEPSPNPNPVVEVVVAEVLLPHQVVEATVVPAMEMEALVVLAEETVAPVEANHLEVKTV